jgi:hypothetical protein
MSKIIEVDPGELHLPPSRAEGADAANLYARWRDMEVH